MRITEGINSRNLLRELEKTQEQMQDAQSQISSGQKISRPSDDPSAASDIVRLTADKSEGGQYERNLNFAQSRLSVTDSILDNVEQMVGRIRTLAQSSLGINSNGSLYATEVSGLRDQIVNSANATHLGRFIFGGSVTDVQPYTQAASGTVAYQGNSVDMKVQVERSATLQTQIPGNQIFNGSVDIFSTVSNLVTAMQSGNKAGIDAELKNLDQFSQVLSVSRSRVGGYLNVAAAAQSELTSARLSRETDLSQEQAADLAQALSQFKLSENALQATLSIGARISQLTILDYLR